MKIKVGDRVQRAYDGTGSERIWHVIDVRDRDYCVILTSPLGRDPNQGVVRATVNAAWLRRVEVT